jgi:hypothetical protein
VSVGEGALRVLISVRLAAILGLRANSCPSEAAFPTCVLWLIASMWNGGQVQGSISKAEGSQTTTAGKALVPDSLPWLPSIQFMLL